MHEPVARKPHAFTPQAGEGMGQRQQLKQSQSQSQS